MALLRIDEVFEWMKELNANHLDIVTGIRPVFEKFDFTQLLTDPQYIYQFYPDISGKAKEGFFHLIKIWLRLTVQLNSFRRLSLILGSPEIDVIALERECSSPRKQIEEKVYWLCF